MLCSRCALLGLLFVVAILRSISAFASVPTMTPACAVTPEVYVLPADLPKSFATSNDLTKRHGFSGSAAGRVIRIEGRVMDIDCVPISGAVVRIWQNNSFGVGDIDLDAEHLDGSGVLSTYDPGFAITGTSVTDNTGYYSFITIFPGVDAREVKSRSINFSVSHHDFSDIYTVMLFPEDDHSLLENDRILSGFPAKVRMGTACL